jgi:TatD DNase family protein
MQLVDSHCHLHSTDYKQGIDQVYESARKVGVNKLICVGTDVEDSKLAISFAKDHEGTWSTVGIHPHEADRFIGDQSALDELASLASADRVVAIGECGLDYFYNHSAKRSQQEILKYQIELAIKYQLPLAFHIRNAFDDFWPIFDSYSKLRGIVHSFTDNQSNLTKAIDRGLFIGVNGISTFTKNQQQISMYKQIPLANLILETDAPYLTPVPFRGMICESKHIKVIADFLADLRGETPEEIANWTTKNANLLFSI